MHISKSVNFHVIALLLVLDKTSNAFLSHLSSKNQFFGVSTSRHMAVTVPPAPPVEKIVTTSIATSQTQNSLSNLPSQKELAEKAKVQPAAQQQQQQQKSKTTNVASGSGIYISDIHYDGDVPKTEADEYIVITNNSKETVDVSGYYAYVATTGTQGPTFYFPKGSTVKPGASVRVYTNEIHKETGGYSFGSGKAIWSNNGGLGVLKDASGKKIMEYKYKPN